MAGPRDGKSIRPIPPFLPIPPKNDPRQLFELSRRRPASARVSKPGQIHQINGSAAPRATR